MFVLSLIINFIVMEKQCSKCKVSKPISEIYTNGYCKVCHSAYRKNQYNKNKELIKQYNEDNKERIKSYQEEYYNTNKKVLIPKYSEKRKEYYSNNKLRIADRQKKYNEQHVEKIKKYSKEYADKNREKISKYTNEWVKSKRHSDPEFKIKLSLRSRFKSALKFKGYRKHAKTTELLGCTVLELKSYLESKFLPTMTWENYGKYWHIDHIIPCAHFDLLLKEEQFKCFHYTNLQPLFAVTTIIDGIEYIGNLNKSDKL